MDDDIEHYMRKVSDLKTTNDRLRGLLKELYDSLEWCPVCDGMYLASEGKVLHADDCRLEQELSRV